MLQEEVSLAILHAAVFLSPDSQWIDRSILPDKLVLCKLRVCDDSPIVTHCIVVYNNLSWTVTVNNKNVPGNCLKLSSIPPKISMEAFKSLLLLVETCSVCPGHPDEHLVALLESKKGKLLSKDGKEVASIDTYSVILNSKKYLKTVRYSDCQMLVSSGKCSSCVTYRNSLRKIYHRWVKQKSLSPSQRESATSRTNFSLLNTPEKQKRYSNVCSQFRTQEKQLERLQEKISTLIKGNGVILSQEKHDDFKTIMMNMTEEVQSNYPTDSFRRVFWEQQLAALKSTDRRQIRWHPAIIKWCLHLKFLSSGAYHALRSSHFLTLPSERSLRDYTHVVSGRAGFYPELNIQLLNEANIREEKDRYIVLIWDEMKIKEDLVFDKHNIELIGFINCGSINSYMDNVERQCESTEDNVRGVASHMLLFMVRGLFTTLEFPYSQFPTTGVSAHKLFPMVWEAVYNLEALGFRVVAFSCDGATSNRKFFSMHGNGHKTNNPYSDDPTREIFFFADVPHLVKTTRNCFSNSFAHTDTRALWVS